MSRLLSAEFMRLWKSKIYWICFGIMAVFGLFVGLKMEKRVGFENAFFIFTMIIGFVMATFCSLFIGTEYSDGTLRNKLIVGHKRISIYFTNLLVCFIAALSMTLIYIITVSITGIPRMGWFQVDMKIILWFFLISIVLIFAYVSIYTIISMLISSKAVVAVICLLGLFALLFVAAIIKSRLEEPEYYDGYVITTSEGTTQEEKQLNPNYLTGIKREIYQNVLEFLPTGQSLQIALWTVVNPLRMAGYSLLILITTTVCGILVFQGKDLK